MHRAGISFYDLQFVLADLKKGFAALVKDDGDVALADFADGAGARQGMLDSVAGLVGEEGCHGGSVGGGEEAEAEVGGVAKGKGP